MGTVSTGRSGKSGCHICLATSPWRLLTPFAERLILIPSGVITNGSWGFSGRVRPSWRKLSKSMPISAGKSPMTSAISATSYPSLPAATGVCVVKTVRSRAAA